MFDFFGQVIGYIEHIFEFFINFIEALFRLIELVAKGIVVPFELLGLMPSFLGGALLAFLVVGIVKFILGR